MNNIIGLVGQYWFDAVLWAGGISLLAFIGFGAGVMM